MFFANDARFPFTYSRMFRDRLRHVLRRVETESRFWRTLYASLPFLCVIYAEIYVNAIAAATTTTVNINATRKFTPTRAVSRTHWKPTPFFLATFVSSGGPRGVWAQGSGARAAGLLYRGRRCGQPGAVDRRHSRGCAFCRRSRWVGLSSAMRQASLW